MGRSGSTSYIVTMKQESSQQQYKAFKQVLESAPYHAKVIDEIAFIKAYVVTLPCKANRQLIEEHPQVERVEFNGTIKAFDELEHNTEL